ncbi:MAG TPA: outer membrane beta-barrel family protein [Chitinophagaceae bacterium]|nr:outer membrane beta-barrel family protein [Chitinophagaceae bacterium]
MKYFLLILSFSFLSIHTFAQVDREPEPTGDMPRLQVNPGRLYGKLIDKRTGKGLEAVSVQIYSGDSTSKDSLITGMLSKTNGDFSFTNLPSGKSYRLVITGIGYETLEKIIETETGNNYNRGRQSDKDLGNIELEPAIRQLGGVTVTSSRPALEMGIDRKVFNVAKSLTSTGGTAIDVMKNIPSVSVDVDGNVQLRNSTPQIFVDGRPTILTLDQIAADDIEKVELITNPSAKFDAASSGGIINVVLKKNKRIGLNGIYSIAIGTPELTSANLNLNMREGKFNFFFSGGANFSGGKADGQTLRQNKSNGVVQDYFNQYTINDRSRRFLFLRTGTDFFIDNRNTLSFTQGFFRGRFENDEDQHQEYLNSNQVMEYYGERFSDSRNQFSRNSSRFSYKHNFPEEGKELTADVNYNYGNRSDNSNIINSFFYPDGTEYTAPARVRNDGKSNGDEITFQADLSDPAGENAKFEAGIRSYHNRYRSYYNAFTIDNNTEIKLPLSNNYEYREMVNAAYVTFSGKKENLSYQLGLRAEYSKFKGLLIDSAFKFGYEYPSAIEKIWDAVFPSVFLTKQMGENNQLQLNYSRRIRRPNFWQLNPFIDINDPANLQQGNPQLRPEFINSFEFNYSLNYKQGNFLGVLYFRNNPEDITRYSDTITTAQYDELKNAGVDPNAIVNTFINASTTNRYGAEFILQHKITDNFDITPSINLQYRTVEAKVGELNLSNKGFNWESKLIINYKINAAERSIFNKLGFQTTGEYESAEVIPQGKRSPQYSVDFAMRKDFLKNDKATITFGINDVFNTNRFGTIYDTETFYQDSYRRRNVRNFRLTFSYKFGDPKFSFNNRNNRNGNEGGDNQDN